MAYSINLQHIGAIILAAGYSSRFGALKALVEINGATMLERAARTFLDASIEQIFVVTGFDTDRLTEAARARGLIPVYNPDFAQGMFSSILAGLAALPAGTEAAFILPVDIPFVSPATPRALVRGISAHLAALPRYQGKTGHPPLIRRAWFDAIQRWEGPDGLQGFFRAHRADIALIDVADPFIHVDIDTPRNLEIARLSMDIR